MWAAKPHYYGTRLLQLALHLRPAVRHRAVRRATARTPSSSAPATTTCCRPPGLGSAAALAARFDIDVTDEAFWTASLDVVRARIDEFCRLAEVYGVGESESIVVVVSVCTCSLVF